MSSERTLEEAGRNVMQGKAQTVLWVEDNEVVRDLGRYHLDRDGIHIVTAENGSAALKILSQREVDVILLDLNLPDIDGLDVLRRVRRKISSRDLPVLVVTASEDRASMVQAFNAGANDYITKPLDWDLLHARMQAQLRLRQRRNVPSMGEMSGSFSANVRVADYDLEALIGRGGRGKVFRARHRTDGHYVALKILPPGEAPPPRFEHDHAVRILEVGDHDLGHRFVAMELLTGITLQQAINDGGPCTLARCDAVMRPLCEVLEAAHHSGLVHGDVKPQNIFLHRTAAGEAVKLLDFGAEDSAPHAAGDSVKPSDSEQLLTSRAGTPPYMAPELFGDGHGDRRIDIYSLGVTLFEMLTGELPYQVADGNVVRLARMHLLDAVPSVKAQRDELPPWIDELIAHTMAKEPTSRPSAADIAALWDEKIGLGKPSGSSATGPSKATLSETPLYPFEAHSGE